MKLEIGVEIELKELEEWQIRKIASELKAVIQEKINTLSCMGVVGESDIKINTREVLWEDEF